MEIEWSLYKLTKEMIVSLVDGSVPNILFLYATFINLLFDR